MLRLLIAATLYAAATTATIAQEVKRVNNEDVLREFIVDKKWTHAWGKTWVKVNSNGTLTGDSPNGKLSGSWYWKGRKWCRTVKIGNNERPEECQTFFMIGDRIMKNVNSSAPKGSYYFLR